MIDTPGREQADGTPRGRDEHFTALVHEIRSALAAIWNAVHMLSYVQDEVTLNQVRQMVARQVEHLSQIVDGIEARRSNGGGLEQGSADGHPRTDA